MVTPSWLVTGDFNEIAKPFEVRLDKALVDQGWQLRFPEAYAENLCRVYCDHCQVLIMSEGQPLRSQNRPFRFQVAWATHRDFEKVVRQTWGRGSPDVLKSLQEVQRDVSKFNQDLFGNIFQRKRQV
ncbi:hypothetical protein AAZX31_18G196000 [Glycine max]